MTATGKLAPGTTFRKNFSKGSKGHPHLNTGDSVVINLLPHQVKFVKNTKRYVALVGGLGCGKSYGIAAKAHDLACKNNGHDGALISRSSKQLYDFLLPEVKKYFTIALGVEGGLWRMKDGDKIVINWAKPTTIHLLVATNDAYKKWAGGNLAWVLIDEIDTMDKPFEVWSYANDRVRVNAPQVQTGCASTPEGYNFLYDFFEKQVKDNPSLGDAALGDRELIRGSTFDNLANLQADYIRNLIRTRNPLALRAYINGEFCNLEGSPVYYRYVPSYENGNYTRLTLKDFPVGTALHIGMDFNKHKNPCVVHVVHGGNRYAIDEIYGLKNSDECIKEIKNRYPDRQIDFYPDASGFEAIQNYEKHFGSNRVNYNAANPKVMQRVASLHWGIQNPLTKERRYFVNPDKCPELNDGLQHQTYNEKNEPDKAADLDHSIDGAGYFHHWYWQVDDRHISQSTLGI